MRLGFLVVAAWSVAFVSMISSCLEPPQRSGGHVSLRSEDASGEEAEGKAKIFTTDLHSSRFQVVAPQVAPQACMDHHLPVLSYMLPDDSEFLQILRCNQDLELTASSGQNLTEVLSLPPVDLQLEMQATDFFQDALASGQCVMVHHGFKEHSVFYDLTAPSGVYYLLRACVTAERIRDREVAGIEYCSRWVSRSPVWKHDNPMGRAAIEKLEGAAHLQVQTQQSYHKLYNIASSMFEALGACDAAEADRQIAVRQKRALNTLLSLGVGAGVGASSGQGFWGSLATGDALSASISSVLNDFTARPEDFPRSCYRGDQLHREFIIEIRRFTDHHSRLEQMLNERDKIRC